MKHEQTSLAVQSTPSIYMDTLTQFSLKHERAAAAAPEDYIVCFPMQ